MIGTQWGGNCSRNGTYFYPPSPPLSLPLFLHLRKLLIIHEPIMYMYIYRPGLDCSITFESKYANNAPWSKEENAKLLEVASKHGNHRWDLIARVRMYAYAYVHV